MQVNYKWDDVSSFEEFERIAYSYRSWPGDDINGVRERYDELVAYVKHMICENQTSK